MKFHVETRNPLGREALYSMYSLELFKYSFVVKFATVTNYLKRLLSRETGRPSVWVKQGKSCC